LRTLVLGGTRSGKSAYGESLLDANAPVRYVATLISQESGGDPEMAERIRRHQQRRPAAWQMVQAQTDLVATLADISTDTPVLIDGLTLWLASLLDTDTEPYQAIAATVAALAKLPNLVVVSDEVGGGLVPEHPAARRFRDLAGDMHQALALVCDRVVLVTAGLPLELKPGRH